MADAVLGVSVTPANVRSVLVEGRHADGATLDHNEYELNEYDELSDVGSALAHAQAGSADHLVTSIGVTWSDDAEAEVSAVLDGMARAGLTDVRAVPLSEAIEALAGSIGRVVGYRRTAVCAIEPGTAALAVVDNAANTVDILISHAVDDDDALIDWLAAALVDDMRPDGLFVVGSVPDLGGLADALQDALDLPVDNPAEADLALAHGAALAAAARTDLSPFDFAAAHPVTTRRNPVVAPLTLLVAGAVTFVVSLSVVVGDQLAPDHGMTTQTREVQNTAGTPPMARPAPAPVAPPPAAPPPPVVAPVLIEEALPPPPPVEALPPAPAPEFIPEVTVPEYIPVEAPAPPPAALPPPPVYQAPVVPERRPGLWERIKDRLKPGPDEPQWELAPGAVPPPGVPIPPG